jgi:diguanylate cyclase
MQAGLDGVRVAMNLSPRELENGSVDDMIVAGLDGRRLPASMLEVEITEEAPIDRQRVSEKLERLSDFGISIALDDFGTGFSTLAALRDSRIRKVKIDKGFIGGIAGSLDDQLLVKAVIDLGGALGIEVLAEGVETEEDCETLRALGCTTAQGFLFSKAVPLEKAIELASGRAGGTHQEMPTADSA